MYKTPKQLERYFKGVSNHRRIQILDLIHKNPGITVDGISSELKCNFKTISAHTHRLVQSGLVNKKYRGNEVTHKLSPYGKKVHEFLSTFK